MKYLITYSAWTIQGKCFEIVLTYFLNGQTKSLHFKLLKLCFRFCLLTHFAILPVIDMKDEAHGYVFICFSFQGWSYQPSVPRMWRKDSFWRKLKVLLPFLSDQKDWRVSILRVELLRVIVRGKFSPGLNFLKDISMGRGISPWRWGHISWSYLKTIRT